MGASAAAAAGGLRLRHRAAVARAGVGGAAGVRVRSAVSGAPVRGGEDQRRVRHVGQIAGGDHLEVEGADLRVQRRERVSVLVPPASMLGGVKLSPATRAADWSRRARRAAAPCARERLGLDGVADRRARRALPGGRSDRRSEKSSAVSATLTSSAAVLRPDRGARGRGGADDHLQRRAARWCSSR